MGQGENMIAKLLDSVRALLNPQSTKKAEAMTKDILYFRTGCIMRGHVNVQTDWSCEGSVGWELGLRPKFLHLSLTTAFSREQLLQFVKPELLAKANSKWLKTFKQGKELMYKLVPGPFLPKEVIHQLWQAVKVATKVQNEDLLPAHPTWIYEKNLGINFCIRSEGSKSFKEAIGSRRDIFYRAGKDLWKLPLFSKRARVLVVESMPGHDDGNMWCRSNKDFMYLVRGIMKFNTQPLMLKGRVIGVPVIPGSESWPEGDYDIVCSQHNIKWGEIPAGTVLEMDVQFVLNEQHMEENDPEEKRKLTVLTLLLAKIRPEYLSWIGKSFKTNAMKVAKGIQDYCHLNLEGLKRLLQDDHKSLISLDQALKVRMGFIRDQDTLAVIKNMQMRKLRSAKNPGQWLAAIARMNVPVGTIWMSIADRIDMLATEVTVIRYPVTSYQSYLTLLVEYRHDVPQGLVILNGMNAKYLALDGDDHVLLTNPFSAFRGREPVLSERANAVKLDLAQLSFMELYTSGANAQGMIGFCFNAMASVLGAADSQEGRGNPDFIKMMHSLGDRLGMLLDMLAQAIKKPYLLDTEVLEIASSIKMSATQHPIAACCLSKELDQVSELEWGVTIPDIEPAEVFNQGLGIIPKSISNMISLEISKANACPNNKRSFRVFTTLASRLKDWVKTQPNLEEAAITYYTIAVRASENPGSMTLVRVMDSNILLLGRTLCEQRYSPLFEL